MVDMFSIEKRSDIMSRIRSTNTVPERLVFSYLRKHRIYFQRHYIKAPGKPDIALPRKKKAVFIHGDFWHGYDLAKARIRFADKPYWLNKIEGNRRRDEANVAMLLERGWAVMVVWQHELNAKVRRDDTLQKIAKFLRK